ncbi:MULTISPECIES: hypothetical protein [unclassified Eubacterium (in: firmicutes)]|uniref:hypothetical protein n=1 Tax=unclassified Eubacterium (in: firmicutes) TaxID=2624479 RepID=UPI000B390ADD|nr:MULTISPECIES: hypothetical protein [unclassified Eubacterium (in: firmicutes)]OUO26273.1 hypothetical protein B5F87_14940 [Eubacterium sp. An3]OUQ63079.1 hypothetical protein B5E53_16590 [Eubacterium sp. An11]
MDLVLYYLKMKVTQQQEGIKGYRIFWHLQPMPDILRTAPIPLFLDCIHIVGNGGSARSRRK